MVQTLTGAPPILFPTDSSVLGAHLMDGGCRFGLWAPRASQVELALVNSDRTQRNVDMSKGPDGVWVVFVPGVAARQLYGFRVHGPWNPDDGMRFNPAKLLIDPYARAITAGVDYSGPILDHIDESDYTPDTRDSAASVPLSVVVERTPPPEPIARRRPIEECVIYETHVKGYTRLHPQVPEHLRGSYAGLAYPAVIDHLTRIGVNTIELLPIHYFVSEPFVVGKGLKNYWGYNTLGFFAPHGAYCSVGTRGEQVREFKDMVTAFHRAGIEVILDVVYNHTGEGGHEGPTLSFRGIDHSTYYRLTNDNRNDYDVTGCGNSVNTSHPGVLTMVLDSLRYWVTEMGVDGFRYDLATTLIRDERHGVDQNHPFKQAIREDPVLSQIKHIAEPWDLGPYGYQVGRWDDGWSEWNDRYRGFTRDFWRGATPGVRELALRLSGSDDLFDFPGASVNFVDAHDGFTMRDLVTYDMKHNHQNREDNHDGSNDNRSWNCGWEGETDDPGIKALRHRQIRNFLATLMTSAGVPMIVAGDELGRTQRGNNNAYCQDSPISWLDWEEAKSWNDVTELMATLTRLRTAHPTLRPADYLRHQEVIGADGEHTGRIALTWLSGFGAEMTTEDWHDQSRTVLGKYSSDPDEAVLVWYNRGDQPVDIVLPPAVWSSSWTVAAHTAEPGEVPEGPLAAKSTLELPGRSVIILEGDLTPLPEPAEASETEDGTTLTSAEMGPDWAAISPATAE
ncbi:MAG: glycogen debranching protein GlgX [Acidipropionibacterium sp.]|jgi:glycogen operon protein|nr:glycogen debranching protein GlgX [Acidipropionibacterium sp.]